MNKEVLSVSNLTAGYKGHTTITDLSFSVNQGEIVTLIGCNGAGKTTTLLALSGIVAARSSSFKFFETEMGDLPPHARVQRGLVHVPEGRKIFSKMTVRENLELGAYLRTDKARVRADLEHVYSLFPILASRSLQKGGTLSGGEQQMLAIGRALMSAPKMLLLDEPSMGIAPLLSEKIFEALSQLNREGLPLLLVEQNAKLALSLAHRAYVLSTGTITITGPGKELLNDPRVQETYLAG